MLEECATSEEAPNVNSGHAPANSGHTPPALVSSKVSEMRKENEPYIKAVVDASRSLLRHVIEGLVPKNGLKHAPVRTHFRILSGAMFLLKVRLTIDYSLSFSSYIVSIRNSMWHKVTLILKDGNRITPLTTT